MLWIIIRFAPCSPIILLQDNRGYLVAECICLQHFSGTVQTLLEVSWQIVLAFLFLSGSSGLHLVVNSLYFQSWWHLFIVNLVNNLSTYSSVLFLAWPDVVKLFLIFRDVSGLLVRSFLKTRFLIWPLIKISLSLSGYFVLFGIIVASFPCTDLFLDFIFKIKLKSYKYKCNTSSQLQIQSLLYLAWNRWQALSWNPLSVKFLISF